MKTNPIHPQISRLGTTLPTFTLNLVIGLLAVGSHGQANAALRGPALAAPPPLDDATRATLGRIGVASGQNSLALRFDKSEGRRFDAEEAAIEGASGAKRLGIEIEKFGDRFIDEIPVPNPAFVIAVGVASGSRALGLAVEELAPIGAILGLNSSKRDALSSQELSELEVDLIQAIKTTAGATRLRDDFLKVARAKTGRALVVQDGLTLAPNETAASEALTREGIQTVLELALERVELRRFTKSDDSFALVVNARARLIRTRDARVLSDLPFEYRSGSGLFLDWTLNHAEAVQRAFATASRRIAERMTEVLFLLPAPAEGKASARLAAQPSSANPKLRALRTTASRNKRQVRAQITFGERPSLAPETLANLGRVGIISTSTIPKIAVQRPLSKRSAMLEACDDAEQILSDYGSPLALLVGSPKQVLHRRQPIEAGESVFGPITETAVRGAAMAISTPIGIGAGLGGQVHGAASGLSAKTLRTTDGAVTKAVIEANPQEALRLEVLRQTQQRTSHPIALVKKPFPQGREEMFSQMACVMAGTLAWIPEGQTSALYLTSQGVDTALEIQLLHPALNGNGSVNPPMALSMEVRASLIQVRDREALYSFTLKYSGEKRKFAQWAANDARPMRDELQSCYQTIAATIVEELAVGAWPADALPALAASGNH